VLLGLHYKINYHVTFNLLLLDKRGSYQLVLPRYESGVAVVVVRVVAVVVLLLAPRLSLVGPVAVLVK